MQLLQTYEPGGGPSLKKGPRFFGLAGGSLFRRSNSGWNQVTLAPLAIGLAVFIAHAVLIPIDGCSINPTRSFGPAVVSWAQDRHGSAAFSNFHVFTVAPCLGATLAAAWYAAAKHIPTGVAPALAKEEP